MDKSDVAEFFEWARDNPQPKPDPDLVTITCERLAVVQLERCAEVLRAADETGYRLLDAARSLHLSMVAAMTAALGGSAGIGAVPTKQRTKAVKALNEGDWDNIPERVMSYAELLAAVQTDGMIEWGPALKLSPVERDAYVVLNELRERIDHPKTSTFIEARAEVRRICAVVSSIVPQIVERAFHHYEEGELDRVRKAAAQIAGA